MQEKSRPIQHAARPLNVDGLAIFWLVQKPGNSSPHKIRIGKEAPAVLISRNPRQVPFRIQKPKVQKFCWHKICATLPQLVMSQSLGMRGVVSLSSGLAINGALEEA
jgi:hypothetical protein